jgi:hypothetical protein
MGSKASVAILLSILFVFAIIFIPPLSTTYAEQSDETKESISNKLFEGKIVVFRVDRSSALETKESSKSMKNASILEIGGRYFVIGTAYVPDDPDYAEYQSMQDVNIGIAWEKVSEYQAFTDEQYISYLKWWKEHNEK